MGAASRRQLDRPGSKRPEPVQHQPDNRQQHHHHRRQLLLHSQQQRGCAGGAGLHRQFACGSAVPRPQLLHKSALAWLGPKRGVIPALPLHSNTPTMHWPHTAYAYCFNKQIKELVNADNGFGERGAATQHPSGVGAGAGSRTRHT